MLPTIAAARPTSNFPQGSNVAPGQDGALLGVDEGDFEGSITELDKVFRKDQVARKARNSKISRSFGIQSDQIILLSLT